MQLGSQEHYDLLAAFEKYVTSGLAPFRGRLDREPKTLWAKGYVYQHGDVNNAFRFYCAGYANARCTYLQASLCGTP